MAVEIAQPKIVIGTYNFTANANALDWGVEYEELVISTFESTFGRKVLGVQALGFNTSGFNDYDAGALNSWLRSNVVRGSEHIATLLPAGETLGNEAVFSKGQIGGRRTFALSAPGQVSTFSASMTGRGVPVVGGLVTSVSTSNVTATANSTPVQAGASPAGTTVYAAVHAVSVSGTTPSLTAQLQSSSTSGGSYTNRGSAAAAITAADTRWMESTAVTTDTWWRLSYTVSGTSPVFAVLAVIGVFTP